MEKGFPAILSLPIDSLLPAGERHAYPAARLNADQTDPLYRRVREHAEKRLVFLDNAPAGTHLADLKEYMRLENEMLLRYQRKGDSGTRVAKARSVMLDVLLERLFDHALALYQSEHGKPAGEVALVALGGYGREEVCPFSDVDLMFLYPNKAGDVKGLQEHLTREVLYPLWDLGLKVGHSTRTVREAIDEGRREDHTRNALLESRRVDGSLKIYQEFRKEFAKFLKGEKPGPYVKKRLADQASRRAKYGGTVFVQEPDIKNGVGGLRDYHNILWMARTRLGVGSLEELVKQEYLSETDAKALERAYDFLLRVRIELHLQSTRATDVLNLEKQPKIAWELGYQQEDLFRRVEAFMRDYYQRANRIYIISKHLEQRLAIGRLAVSTKVPFREVIRSRRMDLQRYHDGFVVNGNMLSYEHRGIFTQEPVRLLRVFRYMQQFGAEPDWELRILISDSVNLLTPVVADSEPAKRCFRAVLQTRGQVFQALQPMHELGVLGRFLPEFDEMSCLVQHEFYHRYTADIHTLETIRVLDEVFSEASPGVLPYLTELRRTSTPTLLYLMLLLHDLGKARAIKGHAAEGARIAAPILERLGLEAAHRKQILWVIENHLEMARFWQRYDIDDTRTVANFASLVGDPETLRYLTVLTYCDTRGTSEGLWNSYKEALHLRLFVHTLERLEGDNDALHQKRKERAQMIHQEVINLQLQDVPPDQVEAHFNLLPERYFIHSTTDEVVLHLRMIHELLITISEADSVGSLVPVVDWRDDIDQGFTVVNIVTWDRAGLFYKLAGALTVAGVNILSTKAISRNDHITIDTFYIVEPGGGVVENAKAKTIFQEHLNDALLKNKDLMPEIQAQARRLKKSLLYRDNRLQANIPPSVDVYHELSLKRTIVEIQANDHIGLLYQLSKAIFDHGFDISFARITTERGVALDTFYIEGREGAIRGAESLLALRDSLTNIVAAEEFLAVG